MKTKFYIRHFLFFLFLGFLLGDCGHLFSECDKHQDFLRDLCGRVKNTYFLNESNFLTTNDHPDYMDQMKAIGKKRSALSLRTAEYGDLKWSNLRFFCEFKERVEVCRKISELSLEQIILTFNFGKKLYPGSTDWYDEKISKGMQRYDLAMTGLNNLEIYILNTFSDYFKCGCFRTARFSFENLYDYGLLEIALGNTSNAFDLADELITEVKKGGYRYEDFLSSQHCLNLGITYAEALDYSKAIEYLTKSIEMDPKNKQAYYERAVAFFETGNFDQALKDYLDSNCNVAEEKLKTSQDFANAFLQSLKESSIDAGKEFVPSLLNCTYGLAECLWVCTQIPQEKTVSFTNACAEAIVFTVEFFKKLDKVKIDSIGNEIGNLYEKYNELNDSEKGSLLGSLIGKYGIEILIPGASLKAISSFKKIQEANRLCNLEAMVISTANREAIELAALKYASEREVYFKNITIHWDRQNKHFPGAHNFIEGKGIIKIDSRQLESLVKQKAGSGQRVCGEACYPGFKERVDFEMIIGDFAFENNNVTNYIPTTKGMIIYSKDGVHVVPSNPNGIIR